MHRRGKWARDHPRLRGEQFALATKTPSGPGSPPLARGTAYLVSIISSAVRITPACAGNSCRMRVSFSASRDHPRLRGEQITAQEYGRHVMGSPPLARGTGKSCGRARCAKGITPACAGNSAYTAGKMALGTDHPRLRGEQAVFLRINYPDEGSPPLARGTD